MIKSFELGGYEIIEVILVDYRDEVRLLSVREIRYVCHEIVSYVMIISKIEEI